MVTKNDNGVAGVSIMLLIRIDLDLWRIKQQNKLAFRSTLSLLFSSLLFSSLLFASLLSPSPCFYRAVEAVARSDVGRHLARGRK
jgi:hypothetical protein